MSLSPVLILYVHQLGPQLKGKTYFSDRVTSVYSKMQVSKNLHCPEKNNFCIAQVRDAVCLVTGSAQGLGKAFAIRLLAAGAK